MVRHIFIASFKDGISEEIKNKKIADLAAMKDNIPSVKALEVGRSTGWEGLEDNIVMTVDFETKEDFEEYMKHPYHVDYIAQTGIDYCDMDSFVVAQFEY